MTRSIGDKIGKSIGIIANPILTVLENSFDSNYFIVLASDGVWDVMTNAEVVNFIENFRHRCKRDF